MASYDPNWLDSMYNNRALVPEHEEHFRRWAADSASVRASQSRRLDVKYGEGLNETLDVFPTAKAHAPVLVFIHGGYWRSLDKADQSFVAPAFTRAGACVVIPNYALCPAVTIPQITMQMVKALAWTWRNIAKYGGNPKHITVAGHSAGGHLAAMMLTCNWKAYDRELPQDLARNALSISGLYELEPLMHTPFLKDSLQLTPAQVKQTSPALLPRPRHGALHTVAGGLESAEFLRHNELIQQAWGEDVVQLCEVLPLLNHFSIVEALADPAHRLNRIALELLHE